MISTLYLGVGYQQWSVKVWSFNPCERDADFFVSFIEIKEYFFHQLNNQKEQCLSFLFTYTWSMEWYFVYNNTAYQNVIWKKFMALDVVHWMILDYLDYSNILCLQLVYLSNFSASLITKLVMIFFYQIRSKQVLFT